MKVFGIGLPKTGTNSLTAALDHLGFRPALHCPWSHAEIALCGSATDLPVAYRFKCLAHVWPDAKFIYTTRNIAEWLVSSERHFTVKWPVARERELVAEYAGGWVLHEAMLGMFGTCEFNRNAWLEGYHRHDADVRAFFRDQPDRLLVIDVTRDSGGFVKWRALCRFLGCPMPHIEFPHENRSRS